MTNFGHMSYLCHIKYNGNKPNSYLFLLFSVEVILIWYIFSFFGRENGWKCYNQKQPLAFLSHQHIPGQMLVLQGVLRRMRFPVYLQDITTMSALRKDGHPSVYGRVMDQAEKQHPRDFSSDCSHWCLPGVPDIWNELLNDLLKVWAL